jgi:hypothetical protein
MKPIRSSHKDFLRSQSITRRRKKKKVLKIWIGFFLIIFFVAGIAWLTSLPSLAIKKVVVVGNIHITSAEIQNISNNILDERYMGIFSKRNAFIYPRKHITETLITIYPRIEEVVIDTESLDILNIKIKERSAQAVWCAAVLCYAVDDKGYIFAEVSEGTSVNTTGYATTTVDEKHITFRGGDQFVGSEPIGKHIFTEKLFTDIIYAVQEMENIRLAVADVHVFNRDEIVFTLARGGKIIFSDRKPFNVSLENLRSSLNSSVFINPKSSDGYAQFEYIDVRFGNKVFYKLDKNKVEMDTKASSSVKNTI